MCYMYLHERDVQYYAFLWNRAPQYVAIRLQESCESHEICDHVESPGCMSAPIVLRTTKHTINSTKPVLVSQSFCLAYFHHARIMTSVILSTMTECSAMSPAGTSTLALFPGPCPAKQWKAGNESSIALTTLFSTVVMVL